MKLSRSTVWAVPVVALAATIAWVHPASSQNAVAAPGAGGVTMDRFVARQTARIMAADTDGDGRVSRAEFAAMAGKRDPSRRFDAMDTNHDGYLDTAEIRIALEKRFHRLDRNGDGILSPDERMAARARHKQSDPAGVSSAAPAQ